MTFHRVKKAGLVWLCAKCEKFHFSKVLCGEGQTLYVNDVGIVR